MAYPDSEWPCEGELSIMSISTKEKQVTWDIAEHVSIYGMEEKKIAKSDSFTVAGATWNFFIKRYTDAGHQARFGINVHTSSAQFDSVCVISFLIEDDHTLKTFKFNFNCEKADTYWVANRLLTHEEQLAFFYHKKGKKIVCRISIKKSSDKRKRTCSLDEDIPKRISGNKLSQDLKQLLLSEEGSDVTFQVGDQQFKAHRSILMARSSVFAAMFSHDMNETATGVVKVEDCEPPSFPVLLEFLYSGSTENLSVENMFSVYKTADKYNVEDLKMECIEFIKNDMEEKALPIAKVADSEPSSLSVFLEFWICGSTEKLSVNNVFILYKYGDKYDLEGLKTKSIEFIKEKLSAENFCEVVKKLLILQYSENNLLKVISDFFARNFKEISLTATWKDLIAEYSVQVNEILMKALASVVEDH